MVGRLWERKKVFTSEGHNLRIGERLLELGVLPSKSQREYPFPTVPPECLPHFLRGLHDGDGCWTVAHPKTGNRVPLLTGSLSCASSEFLKGWAQALESTGIKTRKQGPISWGVGSSNAEKYAELLYSCGGPRLRRKESIWLEYRDTRKALGGMATEAWEFQPQPWHKLLGTMSDKKVAQETGVCLGTVGKYRKILNVPRYVPVPKWHQHLGVMSDCEIGRKFSIRRETAFKARHRLGISAAPSTRPDRGRGEPRFPNKPPSHLRSPLPE